MARGDEDWLSAGGIGRPHGLDGSFHVTHPRSALLVLGASVTVAGRQTEVVRRAGTDARPIVRLGLAGDRAAIEALRGQELHVPRSAAPQLGEDEWWAEDLEGCAVTDGDRHLGTVRRLVGLPSCEMLEVDRVDGGELLVPMVRDAIRAVDVQGRRIDVDIEFLGGEDAQG